MIVLNLKNYKESWERCAELSKAAHMVSKDTGVRVIVCPPATRLQEALKSHEDVFAQHTDPEEPGAKTGFVLPGDLKMMGVKGSLLNHSEHRIGNVLAKKGVELLKKNGMESIVCGANPMECATLSTFNPDFVAVEPPELIGTGISVSTAKPEFITNTIGEVRERNKEVKILCGAGVSKKEDVAAATALGAEGVLLASAYVKSQNPVEFLRGFASAFTRGK